MKEHTNELIIGTTNPAKFGQVRDALITVIETSPLPEISNLPEIVEGKNLVENARRKALTYASYIIINNYERLLVHRDINNYKF